MAEEKVLESHQTTRVCSRCLRVLVWSLIGGWITREHGDRWCKGTLLDHSLDVTDPEPVPDEPAVAESDEAWLADHVQGTVKLHGDGSVWEHRRMGYGDFASDIEVRLGNSLADARARLSAQPAPERTLPERNQQFPAESQGLFHKFDVHRTDGSDNPGGKHYGCRYFVLDVDHDPFAQAALTAYANACESTHPELAKDLRAKWGASPDRQQVDAEEEERAHMQTIAERDAAEDALGDMYALVTGKQAEWSNMFGYEEALEEVQETLAASAQPIASPLAERLEDYVAKNPLLFAKEEARLAND